MFERSAQATTSVSVRGPADAPLVTVITATFNAAATLRACLDSIRAQEYPNIQHLIVDGGSKDSTVAILREHAAPGSWISEPDRGIYDAWNKGLALAKGEWIAFVGADDRLLPGAVSAYMELAARQPEALYLSSRVRWIGPRGRVRIIGKPWSWPRFQRYMCTAHVGSMHRRAFFDQYGQYSTSLPIVADYEMLLRAGPALRTAFLPRVTVEMQGGGNSDNARAIDEATAVKINTGGRSPLLTRLENLWAHATFRVRRLLDAEMPFYSRARSSANQQQDQAKTRKS